MTDDGTLIAWRARILLLACEVNPNDPVDVDAALRACQSMVEALKQFQYEIRR